jgi:hypothetical protein
MSNAGIIAIHLKLLERLVMVSLRLVLWLWVWRPGALGARNQSPNARYLVILLFFAYFEHDVPHGVFRWYGQ